MGVHRDWDHRTSCRPGRCRPDDVILLAQRNKLRAKKEGRFWRFRLEDVLAYRKKSESGGP